MTEDKLKRAWYVSRHGWERDCLTFIWWGRAFNGEDAIARGEALMSAIWKVLRWTVKAPEIPIPDEFLYQYLQEEIDSNDSPGYRMLIDTSVMSSIAKGCKGGSADKLDVNLLKVLITQLAWSDESVRHHALNIGSVKIHAEWVRQDGEVTLEFWMVDQSSRIFLDVSEFTATTFLLMLAHACGVRGRKNYFKSVDFVVDRSDSMMPQARPPQHSGCMPDLLPGYFDQVGLPELKLQYQAIISR